VDSPLPSPLYAVGTGKPKQIKSAKVTLVNGAGVKIGTVKLKEKHDVVEVKGEVEGITPGFHGFHVHAIGSCVAPGFTSAGPHFDQGGHSHANHSGDMPVLLVKSDGTATSEFETDRFHVNDLFDADGSAVIVHALPDNYANIPTDRYDPDPDATTLATGDAGGRVACGVVEHGHDEEDD
jgi:Cu-Zn family superoxide dismutase